MARGGGLLRDGDRLAVDGSPPLPPHQGHRRRPRGGRRVGDPRVREPGRRNGGAVRALARLDLRLRAGRRGSCGPAGPLRRPAPPPPRALREKRLLLLLGVRVQRDRPLDGPGPPPRRVREAPPPVRELLLAILDRG